MPKYFRSSPVCKLANWRSIGISMLEAVLVTPSAQPYPIRSTSTLRETQALIVLLRTTLVIQIIDLMKQLQMNNVQNI